MQAAMDRLNADIATYLGPEAPVLRELLRKLATMPTAGKEP